MKKETAFFNFIFLIFFLVQKTSVLKVHWVERDWEGTGIGKGQDFIALEK
jgi:hypothetical protein